MAKITSQDNKKISYYRRLFPNNIKVLVFFSQDGGYGVEIITFPGCLTQAETFSELIEMVNDAMATVLEVPRKYLPYMPTYLPPLSLAQRLNIFPSSRLIKEPVVFSIL
jgi:predicted RNase H-like HicB family nuclease